MMMIRFGHTVQLLLLATAMADAEMETAVPDAVVYRPQSNYDVDSICNNTIPLVSPTIGNPTLVEGLQTGHYGFPQCANYVQYGGPAAAYRLTGTGDVLEAMAFQGPDYQQSYLTVFRGCVEGGNADLAGSTGSSAGNAFNRDDSVDEPYYPYPADSHCVGSQSSDGARWKTEPGQEYTIIVHGSYQEPSEFVLRVAAIQASSVCGVENRTVPIQLGPVSLKGKISTVGAIYGGPSFLTDLPSCGPSSSLSPTALYLVSVGDANVLVKGSVKGQGQLFIYQGGCDVDGWTCAPTIPNFGNTQQLSWRNEGQGTKYLIAVNNYYGSQAGAGDHLLSISVSPYGNVCEDVTAASMEGFTDSSSLADKKGFAGLTSCDDNSTQLTPTAFYKFTGTGETLLASIRNANYFSARLSLYTVASCNNSVPKCRASDNYNQALSSPTADGETYYLAVYSSSELNDGKSNFTVNIQSVTSDDLCSVATDVGIITKAKSVKVSNSTTGATFITNLNACSNYGEIQSPALAYSFTAGETGMLSVKVQTPSVNTGSFALQLMVLEGSCADAACNYEQYMSYYDNYGFLAQSVEADKEYVVVVFGYGPDQSGPFDLSLELTQVGDPCADALVIDKLADGLTITGSTKNTSQYYFDNVGCSSPTSSVPSMIYAFQSDKEQWIGVSVQSNQMSPYVFVLQDSSSQEECSGTFLCSADGGSYGNNGWSWKAKVATTYYAVVYGCCDSQQMGDFTLRFRVKAIDAVCKNIVKLGTVNKDVGLVTSVSLGDNSTKVYDLVNCYNYGSASESSAVYSLTAGFTGTMIARAGFAMNSYVVISVYTGSCESLACVGGTDSYSPFRFDVQEGTTYYVALSHANSYGDASSAKLVLVLEPAEEINAISMKNNTGKVCSDVEDLGNIPEDGFLLIGTTKDMPSYPGLETCFDTPATSGTKIYTISTLSAGASVSVSVDSIDFDVYVSIYQGTCDGELGCVHGHSAWRNVRFDAAPDDVYYVAVFGPGLASGNFLLHIELSSAGNLCSHSISIASIPETGLTLTGSTENGRIYSNLPSCNGYEQASSRALTYSVQGTGGMMTASVLDTFTSDNSSPQLVVYSNDCDSPQCIDFISGNNQVTWSSDPNSSYFLAVTGCCDSQSLVQFELALKLIKSADLCDEAISLGTPGADGITKTNSHSGYYFPVLSNCSSSDSSQSITGYSIVGTGDVFFAEVSSGSGISVIAGNCTSLTCIGGYGYDSSVSWATEPNLLYYIAVFGGQTGNFTLTIKPISTSSTCDGDDVTNLGTIPEGGLVLQGSTISGTIFRGISPCASGDPRGLWTPSTVYTFTGNGGAYLFMVEDISGFNAQISAYKGDCGDLDCATNMTYGQSMALTTEINAIYTVVVNDCCVNQGGNFRLRIIPADAGDLENDAIDVDVDVSDSGLLINGSTKEGAFYDLPTCYNAISGPGVAYRVHTKGIGSWTASVTGFSVDAQISAFTLYGNDGPVCYGFHNWQQVAWTSDNPNQVVYVVISGSDLSSGGDYALRVRNSATTVSNVCDDNVDLGAVGGQGVLKIDAIQGGSFNVNMSYCSYGTYYPEGDVPAVLYKVQGTGAPIAASVFAPSSGSDVSVVPLIGSCGSFGCISVATSRTSRSVSWTGEAGQTYYIMVMACCGDATFVLKVQETHVPATISGDGSLVAVDEAFSLTEQEEHDETGPSSTSPTRFGFGYTGHIIICIGTYVLLQM